MKRLLIYSNDTFGVGNVRRMMSIAAYLAQHNPALDILLFSGSGAQATCNYVWCTSKQREVS